MKLYYHPVSTVSRPVVLFALDSGIDLDYQVVDLMTGEHLQPAYETINPSRLVPVLEDGDFRLTESSAILKYLADKIGSPAYPKDLQKARAGQRNDGLAQHGLLPRLRIRPRLSADLPAPQAAERRSPGRSGRVGQGQGEVLAGCARPTPARKPEEVLVRQRADDRRLPGRRHPLDRRSHPLRFCCSIQMWRAGTHR